jgi:membrane fusion protein (multidrug efflux system)
MGRVTHFLVPQRTKATVPPMSTKMMMKMLLFAFSISFSTEEVPQQAQIQQKEATLKRAELNKAYTKIYAPSDGYITKRTVEVGNQIQADQPLMAVVPLSQQEIWITANFKETQLKRVKPGQKVKIEVDTYPGKMFHGRVNSIMAWTGAVFSLFPPENATGSFVKVVQRIPVKIVLETGTDPEHLLRIGMSVIPTILIDLKGDKIGQG